MSIPVVDLSEFLSGDSTIKDAFVQKLGKAYEDIGFAAVTNHGVPNQIISRLYQCVQQFFSLPQEIKLQYEIAGLAGQRGYTSFGREHAKGSKKGDLKEFFQYGQKVEDDNAVKSQYPDNVNVKEVEGFDEAIRITYKYLEKSGIALLQAIALYLGLNEKFFDENIHNGNSILRCIHYPPITSEPDTAIRAEQHEDINLITLLVGASADGLEILSREKQWQAVVSHGDQIVVNVGDMLQRLTNNKLRSTTHRVVNPSMDLWNTSRYSIPFFLHPKSNMSLACLDNCISESNPKHYTDITAGEYLEERLREIGLKK